MRIVVSGLLLLLYSLSCSAMEPGRIFIVNDDTVFFDERSLSFGENVDVIKRQFADSEYETEGEPGGIVHFFSKEVVSATLNRDTDTIYYFHFFLNFIPRYDSAPSELPYSEVRIDDILFHSDMRKEDVIPILEERGIEYSIRDWSASEDLKFSWTNGNRVLITFMEDFDDRIASLDYWKPSQAPNNQYN